MFARFGGFSMRDFRRLHRGGMYFGRMLKSGMKRVTSRRRQQRAIFERLDHLIARFSLERGRRTSKATPEFPIEHGKPPSKRITSSPSTVARLVTFLPELRNNLFEISILSQVPEEKAFALEGDIFDEWPSGDPDRRACRFESWRYRCVPVIPARHGDPPRRQ